MEKLLKKLNKQTKNGHSISFLQNWHDQLIFLLSLQDPSAQAPPPIKPLLHPLQETAAHLQLRRAATHRHGDLSPGAGGGGPSAAAGGGGAAAHHPAVAHGEMTTNRAALPGRVWTEDTWEKRAEPATLKLLSTLSRWLGRNIHTSY